MEKVYIFGHQNPDTDAVTAAISLSYLKNKQGLNTEARVLGHISKETKFVLDYFNIEEPRYLNDVKLQIKDIEYHKGLFIDENESIKDAYDFLNKNNTTGTPIVYDNNKFRGIITIKDIARELMMGDFTKIDASYNNILKVLDGEEILKFDDTIKGNILVAAYRSTTILNNIEFNNNNVLIVGDRHSIIEDAVNSKIKLLIITGNCEIKEEHLEIARNNKVNIIKTSNDSFSASKLITLANYIHTIVKEDKSIVFYENDYYDKFINATKRLKHNNYPVLNSKNECLGLIRVTDILKKNEKKVILVDHQEKEQSVDGLDEATILEIVDHHKIGNINTSMPINFRNMTVGSTNTIIYYMYKEARIDIPKDIAGIMISGILSDTLCLQSPTTTDKDKEAVIALSEIANLDYKKYAFEMFKEGTSIKGLSKEEILKNDFKSFPYDDKKFAIGQVFTLDIDTIFNDIDSYLEKIEEIKTKEGYSFIIIMITDILKNGSYLLFNKDSNELIENAFKIDNIEEGIYIDELVSRKKQVLPLVFEQLN